MYKSKLQELCHKEKWGLPKYTCIRDGADHCPLFKASVVVAGAAFHSPSAANSSKQALNQVAQLAFLHFTAHQNVGNKQVESSKSSEDDKSVDHYLHQAGFKNKLVIDEDSILFMKNDSRSYKILLHKLTRDEGFFPPIYKTKEQQESFSTTVEVEGEVFEGPAAESEKLAEFNAAKAAYTALIERKLFEPRYEVLKLGRRFDLCGISGPQEGSPSSPISHTQHQDTIGESEERGDQSKAMKSYLLSNRVRVFTCMPNMALPKGTVVLPISEDRWAVVALEFPNEKAV